MKKLLFLGLVLLACGCTDAGRAQFSSIGSPGHIKLYSGGALVGEWDSTGKIASETQSDGWFFQDAITKKLVRVSGTVVITN